MRSYVRERISVLLDKASEQTEIEFHEEISRPLPGSVIFKMLGIPEDQFDNMRDWSNTLMEVVSGIGASVEKIEKAEQALAEMFALAGSERDKRITAPRDDLITTLVNASVDGDMLTDDEFYSQMLILIVAGHESITAGVAADADATVVFGLLARFVHFLFCHRIKFHCLVSRLSHGFKALGRRLAGVCATCDPARKRCW